MRREIWITLAVAVGFPLLMCGGCGIITLATRPGHDATVMWLTATFIVLGIAAVPFYTRWREKKKRQKK